MKMAQTQTKGLRAILVVAVVALVISIAAVGFAYAAQTLVQSTTPWKVEPQTREFVVVNGALDFNETAIGIPHDTFVPNQIVVNQGDRVVIHLYNTEEEEHHTFTVVAPYSINVDLAGGQHQDVAFTASYAGVFRFYCIYHVPTMSGELTILPASG